MTALGLRVVDAHDLPHGPRTSLLPDRPLTTAEGHTVRRPRFFYEVPNWEAARGVQITPHFGLWEFIDVDAREAQPLRGFPRYVPCAVALLAAHLEVFRVEVGAPVRIAANGGFRSPAMLGANPSSRHTWGTAANIYQIGSEPLAERETIEQYAAIARTVLPGIWCRPFGTAAGETIDHLHLDIGYVVALPAD